MTFADPSIRDANRELHIIGHSAGSFIAMVLSDILQDPKFGPFLGALLQLLSPCPADCLRRTIRNAQSICTMYWKMNFVYDDRQRMIWHCSMTMASRSLLFRAMPYGKTKPQLWTLCFLWPWAGTFSMPRSVPGVVPLFEKQKAPLRLMSWCIYRMSDVQTPATDLKCPL